MVCSECYGPWNTSTGCFNCGLTKGITGVISQSPPEETRETWRLKGWYGKSITSIISNKTEDLVQDREAIYERRGVTATKKWLEANGYTPSNSLIGQDPKKFYK